MRLLTKISFLVLVHISGYGQDPSFLTFEGKVIKTPALNYKKGYLPEYEDYEPIFLLSWDKINVPETFTEKPFPDTDLIRNFGVIFTSKMTIPVNGAYEFCLESDDGSKLWIDGHDALDNDKDHKMLRKCDTIPLHKNVYPIKIWYYQCLLDRYGIIFSSKYIGPYWDIKDSYWAPELRISYEINEYLLSVSEEAELSEFIKSIPSDKIDSIIITSFTDQAGSENYNKLLSSDRANHIKGFILSQFPNLLNIKAIGDGELVSPDIPEADKRVSVITLKIKN